MIPLKKAKGAWTAIGLLVVAGIIGVALRLVFRARYGGVPVGDTVWTLTCRVEMAAEQEGAVLRIAQPSDTAHIRVFGQDFETPGMRQERSRGRIGMKRDLVAIAYRPGPVAATAEFDLHMSPKAGWRSGTAEPKLSPEELADLLKPEKNIEVDSDIVTAALRPLRESKPDQQKMVSLIFDYCSRQITFDPESAFDDAVETLENREGNSLGRARAMVAMCRAAKIHSRLVTGFLLTERTKPEPHTWVEARVGEQWRSYDPEFGHNGTLPANYLPMRRGGVELIRSEHANGLAVEYGLKRRPAPRGLLANGDRNPIQILDLTRLPLATQMSLVTLLLLPFGALLTTFFRNMIGIRTFGTFSPTLLALAAVYADWRTVVIIFGLVIIFGIGGRALLPGFKLMQVPRLSIIFTLVAVSMMLAVSFLDYFGLNPTGQIALLPMVVLTSLVDRLYAVADEDGMRVAAVRLGWTVAVGVLCFALFLWKAFGFVLLEFPEVHFFTIALMLLFGLYNGTKLSEVPHFGFLAEPASDKKKKKSDEVDDDDGSSGDGGKTPDSENLMTKATTNKVASDATSAAPANDPVQREEVKPAAPNPQPVSDVEKL